MGQTEGQRSSPHRPQTQATRERSPESPPLGYCEGAVAPSEGVGEESALTSVNLRRRVGAALVLLAITVTAWLLFRNVPPVVMSSTYFVETHLTKTSVQPNPLLILACCIFFCGMALVLFPRRHDRKPIPQTRP